MNQKQAETVENITTSTEVLDDIQIHEVCIQNLCVRNMHFLKKGVTQERYPIQYDTVVLVTNGTIGATMDNEAFTIFEAPHMIILEKGHKYVFEAMEDNAIIYDISALRHNTGDIVNPENFVRANYPFDTAKSFEEQQQ